MCSTYSGSETKTSCLEKQDTICPLWYNHPCPATFVHTNQSQLGAVQFIENLDRTSLTISDEDFEKNVEAAVFAIAEKHRRTEELSPTTKQFSEKSSLSRPEVSPRHSTDGEASHSRGRPVTAGQDTGEQDENAATALLRTIQRPLNTIGRIFSDEGTSTGPARTPLPGNTPRLTPSPRVSTDRPPSQSRVFSAQEAASRNRLNAEEAAARQASAETAEAHRIQRAEHHNVVETLAGMFPDLDRDLISDVVVEKNGR